MWRHASPFYKPTEVKWLSQQDSGRTENGTLVSWLWSIFTYLFILDVLCGMWSNPHPPHWKHGVLTAGCQGSPWSILKYVANKIFQAHKKYKNNVMNIHVPVISLRKKILPIQLKPLDTSIWSHALFLLLPSPPRYHRRHHRSSTVLKAVFNLIRLSLRYVFYCLLNLHLLPYFSPSIAPHQSKARLRMRKVFIVGREKTHRKVLPSLID